MGSGRIQEDLEGNLNIGKLFLVLVKCLQSWQANQFSIFISRDAGNKEYSSVLAPACHEGVKKYGDVGISSSDWNLSGQHSTYHALFPRALTVLMVIFYLIYLIINTILFLKLIRTSALRMMLCVLPTMLC